MRYRWILFDADGVLFDYDAAERAAFAAAWSLTDRSSAEPVPEEVLAEYRTINAALWREFEQGLVPQDRLRVLRFERLLARVGVDHDAAALSATYLDHLGASGAMLPGARAVLESLHGRVGMVMITNGIAEVQRGRIARADIGRFFAGVTISAEVGAAKPDPRIFEHALRSAGDPPRADVLMVGDSLGSDILGGVRAGLDTCWVNAAGASRGDGPAPTYEVASVAELPALLGQSDGTADRESRAPTR